MRAFLASATYATPNALPPKSTDGICLDHLQQGFDITVGRTGFIGPPLSIPIGPVEYPGAVANGLLEPGYPGENPRIRIVVERAAFKQLHLLTPDSELDAYLLTQMARNPPVAKAVEQLFDPSDFKLRKRQASPLSRYDVLLKKINTRRAPLPTAATPLLNAPCHPSPHPAPKRPNLTVCRLTVHPLKIRIHFLRSL